MDTNSEVTLNEIDIIIDDINKCLIDTNYYSKTATTYLDANKEFFENLKIRIVTAVENKSLKKQMPLLSSKKHLKTLKIR